jgi:hypothetical protein
MSLCLRVIYEDLSQQFLHDPDNPHCLDCGEDESLKQLYTACKADYTDRMTKDTDTLDLFEPEDEDETMKSENIQDTIDKYGDSDE